MPLMGTHDSDANKMPDTCEDGEEGWTAMVAHVDSACRRCICHHYHKGAPLLNRHTLINAQPHTDSYSVI